MEKELYVKLSDVEDLISSYNEREFYCDNIEIYDQINKEIKNKIRNMRELSE